MLHLTLLRQKDSELSLTKLILRGTLMRRGSVIGFQYVELYQMQISNLLLFVVIKS